MRSLSQILILSLLSLITFSGCGPERSTEEIQKEERKKNEKLSRQELLDQADAMRPQIEVWVGCYKGTYNNGGKIEVVVSLREWFRLVSPGANMDPVEMPVVLGTVKSFSGSDQHAVPLTEFIANGDATVIEMRKPNSKKTYMSLRLDPARKHRGYYETEIMDAKLIQLEPIASKYCGTEFYSY